jgi:hypothetical protein
MHIFGEPHFVRRDRAVYNGLLLIGCGISLLIFNPTLCLFNIPLAVFPILHGISGIILTVNRTKKDIGPKVVCSSLATTIMLVFVLVVQIVMGVFFQ